MILTQGEDKKELTLLKETMMKLDFVKTVLAGIPTLPMDRDCFPRGEQGSSAATDQWDAAIIGAGLGGLSGAAAFAR